MVFPNTELLMSLKKSFSNEFLESFHFSVLKSIYCLSQGDWSNLALGGLSLFSNQDPCIADGFASVKRTLSCLSMLELVYILSQLICYIFQQSFCSTPKACYWIL